MTTKPKENRKMNPKVKQKQVALAEVARRLSQERQLHFLGSCHPMSQLLVWLARSECLHMSPCALHTQLPNTKEVG